MIGGHNWEGRGGGITEREEGLLHLKLSGRLMNTLNNNSTKTAKDNDDNDNNDNNSDDDDPTRVQQLAKTKTTTTTTQHENNNSTKTKTATTTIWQKPSHTFISYSKTNAGMSSWSGSIQSYKYWIPDRK